MLAYLHVATVSDIIHKTRIGKHFYIPVTVVRVADRYAPNVLLPVDKNMNPIGVVRSIEIRIPGVDSSTTVDPDVLLDSPNGALFDYSDLGD